MLGWQERTLNIHILELYDEFHNLVTVSLFKDMISLCDSLATTL